MGKNKKIISAVLVTLAALYMIMLAFPISSFYEISTIDETKYTPGERTIVEIPKKFCFLPGPRTVWAVKT